MISSSPPKSNRWQRVSRSRPCPVCQHHSWCVVAPDGGAALCARVESKDRRGDAGWLHHLRSDRPIPIPVERTAATPERAPDDVLDRVYRSLLSRLLLSSTHHEALVRRGLTAADIERNGYRTLPARCRADLAKALRDTHPDGLLRRVPGIVAREGPHGRYLTVAGLPGLLVPVRNVERQIVGLLVRPDEPGDGGKYAWLSSRSDGGPSPSARAHVPLGVQPARRVIVTEGTLKADVAFALSGRAIIGLPGPYVTAEAITTLLALGAAEVLLALDADAATNPHIAEAQLTGLRRLHAAGFQEGLLRWPTSLGKGLDDALLTWKGGRP